jgi:NAD(P)-dependent dehydrogenase (short-subunit alcohol dehydrogenase family)
MRLPIYESHLYRGVQDCSEVFAQSNPAEASRLISATLHRFGRLDILINTAGIIVVGPAENQPLEA